MAQTQQGGYLSFEELNVIIQEVVRGLAVSEQRLTREPLGLRLQNLQSAAYSIDAPVVYRPTPFEQHVKEWTRYISGANKSLGKPTIKYLCWVPEIAIDERFLLYVESSSIELNWRSLAGLVRACHCKWEELSPESTSLSIIRVLLKRYRGPNRALRTWQTHPDALIGQNGPLLLVEILIRAGRSLDSFLDEWRLETQSIFFQIFIEIVAARCRVQINRLPEDVLLLLFRDILSWQGWRPSAFKKEIGALILHKPMSTRAQETVQRFVLHHKELGDPRLPVNRIKWAEVPVPARNLFVQWLRKENPLVFSEHIFQQGRGWTWQQKANGLEPLAFEREEWR
jgi:hypothetical protein